MTGIKKAKIVSAFYSCFQDPSWRDGPTYRDDIDII